MEQVAEVQCSVIFLTDEEVRRLTEAGCEIYPMKRVETDKNENLTKR